MNNKLLEVTLRYIGLILLLTTWVGCGAQVTYGEWPYKATPCIPGDKAAAWDAYTTWYNVLLEVRRTREERCNRQPNAVKLYYVPYCVDLNVHHARVEKYVEHLNRVYTDTCTPDSLQF